MEPPYFEHHHERVAHAHAEHTDHDRAQALSAALLVSGSQNVSLNFGSRADTKTHCRALNAVGITIGGSEFHLDIRRAEFDRLINLHRALSTNRPGVATHPNPRSSGLSYRPGSTRAPAG